MKKLLITFSLLCVASVMSAQRTYYYECEKVVNNDGVSSKVNIGTYFTFANNGVVYESDAKGNQKGSSFGYTTSDVLWKNTGIFYYRNTSNGSYLYCSKQAHYERIYTGLDSYHFGYQLYWDENFYILVSNDHSTINVVKKIKPNFIRNISGGAFTYVLTRSTPPKPEDNIPILIK